MSQFQAIFDPSTGNIAQLCRGNVGPSPIPGFAVLQLTAEQAADAANGGYWVSLASGVPVLTAYTTEQRIARARHPQYPAVWNNQLMAFQGDVSVAQARVHRIAQMRAAREAAIAVGFAWDGSTFDSDPASQTRLLGLMVAAQQPGFEPVAWRLADNSWRTLTAADAAEIWNALTDHVRLNFTTFAAREAAINEATTLAAVDAVTWA